MIYHNNPLKRKFGEIMNGQSPGGKNVGAQNVKRFARSRLNSLEIKKFFDTA